MSAAAAQADDVVLRSQDGGVSITGTLLGFDGEFYRIASQYGELTVDSSGVRCEGVACPSLTDFVAELRLSGSGTIGRVLLPALIEGFALREGLESTREAPSDSQTIYTLSDGATGKRLARFYLTNSNTDEGFADLLADEADMVMALREIRPDEAARAAEAGLGDLRQAKWSRVLALDALVPVVSGTNPVEAISIAALEGILAGRIDNWADLGGPDAPITLHLPAATSGLAQTIERRLLDARADGVAGSVIRHGAQDVLAGAVAIDPFGLGIASFSETGLARPLALTGACGFSLRATRRTIKTEDWPLTAPMFLYLPARRLPKIARDFLAYSASAPAQNVIRRVGFTDQAAEEVPVADQGARLANAIAVADGEAGLAELKRLQSTLGPRRRLTTSFRFEPGSARLDAQSRANVETLAAAIEAGVYDTRDILFAGFSDGVGPASANRAIARKRAEAVRQAVLDAAEAADPTRLSTSADAFGEAMPMACDDTTWGRGANRRVEIWLD
ncbi:Outer membrane porin F precursor [Roseivivax sp. THAF40]|uniref:phosphate ABC transporter substrate-binding/OmpA family protein n=1 Tax=unclassified Roseivivax TaxID=2639302 RepID=UPI0012A83A57|nr:MULTISPECIES: phosphate ABC transporter substrate-binding/OmpA family protein [unclassified Roseivivax]QFS84349.1 Outer membrane porin F precursor [Roseivivax sp. THAF197b]QFT48177.1 Outer membrane porin F precursor [Roseivivax sp. THAF40]